MATRTVPVAHPHAGQGVVGHCAQDFRHLCNPLRKLTLLRGRDDDDPLLLQVKEAQPSVLERHLGPGPHTHHGQRVVVGQRLMQSATDILLGWVSGTGPDGTEQDFYVRQLRDWKGSADLERITPAGLAAWARLCGWTLARAHARSGDRVAIATYLGSIPTFDHAVARFASSYADQNERDVQAFRAAVDAGRPMAVEGL